MDKKRSDPASLYRRAAQAEIVTKRYTNERAKRALLKTRITRARPIGIWTWGGKDPAGPYRDDFDFALKPPFEPETWLERIIADNVEYIRSSPLYPNECIYILAHGVAVACVHRKGQKPTLTAAQAEAECRAWSTKQ